MMDDPNVALAAIASQAMTWPGAFAASVASLACAWVVVEFIRQN